MQIDRAIKVFHAEYFKEMRMNAGVMAVMSEVAAELAAKDLLIDQQSKSIKELADALVRCRDNHKFDDPETWAYIDQCIDYYIEL